MDDGDVERMGEVVEEEDRYHQLKIGEGLEEVSVTEEVVGEMVEIEEVVEIEEMVEIKEMVEIEESEDLQGNVVQINDKLEVLVDIIAQVLQVTEIAEIAKNVHVPKGVGILILEAALSETEVVGNAMMIRESEEIGKAMGMIWRNPFVVCAIT